MWNRRCTFDRVISETFRVAELQKIIKSPFVTDRAAQSRSDVGAAGRPGAVIGVDHHVIGQLQIEVVQCVKLLFRELLGVFVA